MEDPNLADWIQACAAVFTMLAAFTALWIASKAPRAAAGWAEKYRKQSEQATEAERLRMNVFVALMKCRSQILHVDAIAALNVLDVAFHDHPQVRNSYRFFIEATNETPSQPVKIVERYHAVIEKVAQAVGLADAFSPSDMQAGYYPMALGKLNEAALAKAEEQLAKKSKTDAKT